MANCARSTADKGDYAAACRLARLRPEERISGVLLGVSGGIDFRAVRGDRG